MVEKKITIYETKKEVNMHQMRLSNAWEKPHRMAEFRKKRK